MNFEYIVVPTDFSESAFNAFKFACGIAKNKNSHVHLVHVFQVPYGAAAFDGGWANEIDVEQLGHIERTIREKMQEWAKNDFAKDLHIFERVYTNIPAWKFYEQVENNKCDLICMGTRGVTGLIHGGLIGTNTERVIRHASTPVLSVHQHSEHTEIKKILFATDFQDPLDNIFPSVLDFAKMLDAEVVVGFVNTREYFSKTGFVEEQFKILSEKYPYPGLSLIVHNDISVEEGLADMINKNGVHLLAMLTHGRTGVAHLVKGSIAEELSAYLSTPLLTFKNK